MTYSTKLICISLIADVSLILQENRVYHGAFDYVERQFVNLIVLSRVLQKDSTSYTINKII